MKRPHLWITLGAAAVAFCVAALTGCAGAAYTITPRTKVALVIGNTKYTVMSSLRNPVNDMNDMCRALRKKG